jgi:hypothetical protein
MNGSVTGGALVRHQFLTCFGLYGSARLRRFPALFVSRQTIGSSFSGLQGACPVVVSSGLMLKDISAA